MSELTVVQKAACEAIWRALQERNVDRTGLMLQRGMQDTLLRSKIQDFVQASPASILPRIVLPEITNYGALPGGYTVRWAKPIFCDAQYNERQADLIARNNTRISQMQKWPSSHTTSSGGDDDATPTQEKTQPKSI